MLRSVPVISQLPLLSSFLCAVLSPSSDSFLIEFSKQLFLFLKQIRIREKIIIYLLHFMISENCRILRILFSLMLTSRLLKFYNYIFFLRIWLASSKVLCHDIFYPLIITSHLLPCSTTYKHIFRNWIPKLIRNLTLRFLTQLWNGFMPSIRSQNGVLWYEKKQGWKSLVTVSLSSTPANINTIINSKTKTRLHNKTT
jgi:hypothetical protein